LRVIETRKRSVASGGTGSSVLRKLLLKIDNCQCAVAQATGLSYWPEALRTAQPGRRPSPSFHSCDLGRHPSFSQARGYFERALARDPTNVEALLGAAWTDAMRGTLFIGDDRAQCLAATETAAIKILSLAPNHAFAHFVLGYVQIFTNRVTQGIVAAERALALDRNLAIAHAFIGAGKTFAGRAEETEAHVQEALRLSPRDSNAYHWMASVAAAKLNLGVDAEAVQWARRAIEANRNFPLAHLWLAAALAQLGRLDEARQAVQPGLALAPGFTIARYRAGVQTDNPTYLAQRERIIEGMRKAGVPEG
jgi:tetratricopeptide (TPR) repeat protein